MIKFRSVELKKNSKGGDMVKAYLDVDQVDLLAEILTAKKTGRGIRMDLHISDKEVQDGSGRTFKSCIGFFKGVDESAGAGKGGFGGGAKPFGNKGTTSAATVDAISRLKKPNG
jgi:hypothetical protein